MAKRKIKVIINNNDKDENYVIDSIFLDNTIKYKDNDNTLVVVDLNNNSILRENDDIKMLLTFDINNYKILNCEIKKFHKFISFNIRTIKLDVSNNCFKVKYDILSGKEVINQVNFELYLED